MTTLGMQEPIVCGERIIVPVVRESGFTRAGGVFAGVSPVALLIRESGSWFFVAIEEGFGPDEIAGICSAGSEPVKETAGDID
jgi:hypothetical protein